jgi:capsular exopolysaccharide synthesis family protein
MLRRWPWVFLAVAAGVGGGYYYHTKQPAVFRSEAEVRTTRAEGELKSDAVLRKAAAQLNPAEFEDPPPASIDERVAYLREHLGVSRTSGSNAVALTFDTPNPNDAPKYLAAVIAAYPADVGTPTNDDAPRLAVFTRDIEKLEGERAKAAAELSAGLEQFASATRLEPGRPELKPDQASQLKAAQDRVGEINALIARIDALAGKPRANRDALIAELKLPPTPSGGTEEKVKALKKEMAELQAKRGLGPDHPEILDRQTRIDRLEKESNDPKRKDSLDEYRAKLVGEQAEVRESIVALSRPVAAPQNALNLQALSAAQARVTAGRAAVDAVDAQLAAKTLERDQLRATKSDAPAKVDVTAPPGPAVQVAPVLTRSLATGGVLGLLVGGALAVGAGLFAGGPRAPAVRGRRLGSPLLGRLPKIRTDAAAERPSNAGLDRLLATFYRPSSTDAEAFRQVRGRIYSAVAGKLHQVIQVTSPTEADGKSVLAANLAVAIALTGRRVLLIDCDLRTPRVHQLLNRRNVEVGLTSVLTGEATPESVVVTCDVPNLFVLPCGPVPADPTDLLGGAKFAELIAEVRPAYDFVIVDSPAVLTAPDATVVARRADGVVLVVRAAKEAAPDAERAREQLDAARVTVLGAVENTAPGRPRSPVLITSEDYVPPEPAGALPRKG